MNKPLVTIICLCYNHAAFLRQAIDSVLQQTYSNLQIILIDDASSDGSSLLLEQIGRENPTFEVLLLKENKGNCAAFNLGWKKAKGEYIIDFATDDILLPDRVEKQVVFFAKQPANVGVIFSDASYVTESGKIFRHHFEYLKKKKLISKIPQGEIFREVLSTYFIPSPTMMIRREVLEVLNGYDENLSYEDFDFWVRSSRVFHYAFMEEITTLIRRTDKSMSAGWYKIGDRQLHSTYLICVKAKKLYRNDEDKQALIKRVRYEFRQSVFSHNKAEAQCFGDLLKDLNATNGQYYFLNVINKLPLPLAWIRQQYHTWRYR